MRNSPVTQTVSFNRSPLYILMNLTFTHSLTPPEVMNLITELNLGVEAIIIGVTPDLSDKANPLYQVGLKNPIYDYIYICNLVRRVLSQHLSRAPEFIKRRGWNALCAMYPDLGCHILLWGISTEEFIARQYASTKKIGLYFAKAIISRAGHGGTISQYSSNTNILAISNTPSEPKRRKATKNATDDESASSDKPVSTDVTDSSPALPRESTDDGSASTISSSEANEVNVKVKEPKGG